MTCGQWMGRPPMSREVRFHYGKGTLRERRAFMGFLASALSASVGRNGYYIACSWTLVEAGYGSASVATLLAIVSVVEFVASPLAGAMADRFDRRLLNIAADVSRFAVLLATACALPYLDLYPAIWCSAIPLALCDRVALTSSQSMIPLVARGGDLTASNSIVFFVTQFGCLAAALLVGALPNDHSATLVFVLLAVCFLVSAGSLSCIRGGSASGGRKVNGFVLKIDGRLVRLFAVYALLYGGAVLVSVMGSSFVFVEQKGTAADFARVEAAWSAGSLIGAALLSRLTRTISPHPLHLMVLGLTALALMALVLLRAPWTLTMFAALGFLYNLGRVSVEVTLQSRVPDKALGRAKGAMHGLAVGLGFVIFSIATVLGDQAFASTIFLGFAVVLLFGVSALSINVARQEGDP
ncbi:MAG: MFS transporter [Mesorhizobium sp.]|nr:MAG: MFS transporter [Mesorhizobium sp.]TJW71159.1 MAG: MFS transporter [Mesorhizobium sp.]